MGNAQVRGEEPRVLLTEYQDLVYRDMLGSYKLFKVMQCVHEREGPVVVKLFVHREGAPEMKDVQQKVLQLKTAFSSLWMHPNVVPYQGMEIASRSAVFIRQHFARNLYDRIHTRPFLSDLTKNWIAFQVLCSVSQAHSMGVAHGDLKTENIFMSSWNHAVLSDFAWFKPLFLPEDDPSEFSFFFESNLNRRRCYLAPERFDAAPRRFASSATRDQFSLELEAMDIFSLGCVLAELYLDGQTLMDLPQLLLYRARQHDLSVKVSSIRNTAVQEMINSMIHWEPSERKPAAEYLRQWCDRVAPRAFCNCLFPLSVLLLHPIHQHPDMRVLLIRRNFSNILWSTVGPEKIGKFLSKLGRVGGESSTAAPSGMGEAAGSTSADAPSADAPSSSAAAPSAHSLWDAWARHVGCRVRSADEATLHGAVHAAAQVAGQWDPAWDHQAGLAQAPGGGASAGEPEACPSERSRHSSSGASASQNTTSAPGLSGPGLCTSGAPQARSGGAMAAEEGDEPEASADRSASASSSRLTPPPRLCQPRLREDSCGRFASALFGRWEDGRRCAINSGEMQPSEGPADTAIYRAFLVELCARGGDEMPGLGPRPRPAGSESTTYGTRAETTCDEDDILSIVCQVVCACVQHLSSPRMKIICLDMFEQMAPFASQSAILDQLVPYTHALMTDSVAKVRARAVDVLTSLLEYVGELPPSDTPLFVEYLFPQLMSSMSGMSGEPVVLLAIARNIGALARLAVRFAELSVEALQRGTDAAGGCGGHASGDVRASASDAPVEVESFDVQSKHLREWVKKVVKALLECLPIGLQAERFGSDDGPGSGALHEELLLNLAMGREIKMALLRNMCVLADVFGRDGTHNFLLPYLISFMNDPAWEVRAAFCEEAAGLPRKVGQVSTEGIIWPCYEQALLDLEERVLQSALSGLSVLVSQEVLKRQSLVTVASKAAPLLLHPSDVIRRRAADVFDALGSQLSLVDQYVFVMPAVRPFLQLEVANLHSIGRKLLRPLGRQIFKRAILQKDEELYDALVNKKPLPLRTSLSRFVDEDPFSTATEEGSAEHDEAEGDFAALELMRPYLQLLLRSRPAMSSGAAGGRMGSALAAAGSALRDEIPALIACGPPAILQSLQYCVVNPHCAANRSLQALTEADECGAGILPAALAIGQGPGAARHPLGLFSMQAYLAQALCLPPRRRDLGSLSYLEGTPYSIYATDVARICPNDVTTVSLRTGAGDIQSALRGSFEPGNAGPSAMRQAASMLQEQQASRALAAAGTPVRLDPWRDLCDSSEPSTADASAAGSVVAAGLSSIAAMTASSGEQRRGGGFEPDGEAERARAAGAQHRNMSASWRPRGVLLATLYEYAHQSGVPVVKVDTTDDSRILITGGRDGVVKIWNCAALERDVAVASSHTFTVPYCDGANTRRRQRLRALRTVRDSKAVAIGTESGDVLLHKIEPSRGGATATQVCRFPASEKHGAIMCIEQFDTELESLVVFAQQQGKIQGWDVRSRSPCWSVGRLPPWLGVPNCMALGSDGHAITAGTLGGGLLVYDLRFLAPWKQWKVSAGAAVLALRSADFGALSPGVFAALGGDANEVALFDVARGSCMTLFLTEPVSDRQKDVVVSVPSLSAVEPGRGFGEPVAHGINPEQLQANLLGGRRSGGCVRSLWLPPRGAQTFLLAGGTDRKVRHWSLDPEHPTAEAYIVTPHDSLSHSDSSRGRTTYSSNHLGDVFVVQEQSVARIDASSSRTASKPQGSSQSGHGDMEARGITTNPNHRDAILDMCTISLQNDILVTAGRDGLVKLWK